jgi:hypothetical protein
MDQKSYTESNSLNENQVGLSRVVSWMRIPAHSPYMWVGPSGPTCGLKPSAVQISRDLPNPLLILLYLRLCFDDLQNQVPPSAVQNKTKRTGLVRAASIINPMLVAVQKACLATSGDRDRQRAADVAVRPDWISTNRNWNAAVNI